MKVLSRILIILTCISLLSFACNQNDPAESDLQPNVQLLAEDETTALLDFFKKTGNYINSEYIPALVMAEEVHDFADEYKLIDIRDSADYTEGHIEGAVNIQPEEIIDYLKFDVSAVSFEKIVIICNTGLDASFVTTVLRLLGYGNVYALKYGMSAWNKEYADAWWSKHISSAYASQLVSEYIPRPKPGNYPKIMTGKKMAYEILEERSKQILDHLVFKISADSLFTNLSAFFIVNYWPEFQYQKGHIPGAYQYSPRESLAGDSALFTLPDNKPVLIYDYTGHHSAGVAAYLQILGYDAYALEYGTNALMYNQLVPKKIGRIFKNDDVNDFDVLEGMFPTKEEKQRIDSIITVYTKLFEKVNNYLVIY